MLKWQHYIKVLVFIKRKEFIIIMEKGNTVENVKKGISFGSALAMVISYTKWHSVGWAIIHGLMSWAYVIYYVLLY